ncbi:MAG: MaoC/PaaZ C-terminal domain-containing protein [Nitrososphaeria archaeon]|nr:MaoC/PaaZ C-terminal domain-containing protein [Nitrososphaeria archaeon]
MRIRSWPGRTFRECDNHLWLSITGDCVPLYVDSEFAKSTEFRGTVIHPLIVLNAAIALSIKDTSCQQHRLPRCGVHEDAQVPTAGRHALRGDRGGRGPRVEVAP